MGLELYLHKWAKAGQTAMPLLSSSSSSSWYDGYYHDDHEHDYDHDNEFSSTIFLRSTTFLRQRPFMFGSRPTAAIWEKKEDEVYCQNTTIHCIGVFDIVWYETGIWDLRSYPCVIQVIHIVCFIGSSQTTLPNHRNGFINPHKTPNFYTLMLVCLFANQNKTHYMGSMVTAV